MEVAYDDEGTIVMSFPLIDVEKVNIYDEELTLFLSSSSYYRFRKAIAKFERRDDNDE